MDEHLTEFEFTNARVRLPGHPGHAPAWGVDGLTWRIGAGETWVIAGGNGSGKSLLAAAVAGQAAAEPPPTGRLVGLPAVLVSFETQTGRLFDEFRNDESEFAEGGVDHGTSLGAFLGLGDGLGDRAQGETLRELAEGLGLLPHLERGIKHLSTGELRKACLARDLAAPAELLVLDGVLDGLDAGSRAWLLGWLGRLIAADRPRIVLAVDREEHVPPGATHLIRMGRGRPAWAGPRHLAPAAADGEGGKDAGALAGLVAEAEAAAAPVAGETEAAADAAATLTGRPLVAMRNLRVAWDGRAVFDRFDWTLRAGGHTLVRGPNGCGKSTLLKLITGDCPQVYANDVEVLGFRRGGGESIWDIKRRIGYVSWQFHVDYAWLGDVPAREVLVSGFHDSIGLYEAAGDSELAEAGRWLAALGLADRAGAAFRDLSYGEQRALLVARAVVKRPPLLVLDEPCHGLDAAHRDQVVALVDRIAALGLSTVLYVTHDPSERPSCIRRVLEHAGGSWREGPAD